MQAIRILMDEHRLIERVLDALETASHRIGSTDAFGPSFFLDAVDFIRNFADAFHHMKEEDVLFEFMVASGMPREGGPIAVMLYEHEVGRRFVRAMKAAAESWAEGQEDAQRDLVENAQGFIELLRQHISKEDNILYTIAAQVLSPEQQDRVLEEFQRVEAERTIPGTRDKYEALAVRLEDTVRQALVRG